jgi:predicted CXXCH cytochrome family protein
MREVIVYLVLLAVLVAPFQAMAAVTLHTDTTNDGYTCVTCHTAHNAGAGTLGMAIPLWAGLDPNYTQPGFTMYPVKDHNDVTPDTSPTGASGVCLSCHDGSSDLMDGGNVIGSNDLGTTLTNMHPISFTYKDGVSGYKSLSSVDGAGYLDASDKVQCSSCHEIHDDSVGKALRDEVATNSTLCKTCHDK